MNFNVLLGLNITKEYKLKKKIITIDITKKRYKKYFL
jgi:hypothetical protein